jgi:Helix-turn-helix domain
MATQAERVLAHLQTGRRLTQFEALQELGILRLASRINDLKRDGHDISSKMVAVSNRFGESCHVASYTLGARP